MYGQPTFAIRAGKILQKAIMPFGVEGGTKSSAADRMITYNTGEASQEWGRPGGIRPFEHTIVD